MTGSPFPSATQHARLVLLSDAPDAEGQPRVALSLSALATGRRAALVIFPTIAAALDAKRDIEANR